MPSNVVRRHPLDPAVFMRTVRITDFPVDSTNKPVSPSGDLPSPPPLEGLKSLLLNSVSMTTTSFSSSTEKLTSQMTTSTVSKKAKVVHASSTQELHQGDTFHENRNFTRSISVTASSDSKLKMVATDRRFSVDDALDEKEEDIKFQKMASKKRLEKDGMTTEKAGSEGELDLIVRTGEDEKVTSTRQGLKQMKTVSSSGMKSAGSVEKVGRQMYAQRRLQEERNMSSSSSSSARVVYASRGMSTKSSSLSSSPGHSVVIGGMGSSTSAQRGDSCSLVESSSIDSSCGGSVATEGMDDDLETLSPSSTSGDVEKTLARLESRMTLCVERLKSSTSAEKEGATAVLNAMNMIIRKAWAVPTFGYDLGSSMCTILRNSGGLDLLITNCSSPDETVQFSSARLLEQCLSTENRAYVVENGLEKVVEVACLCSTSCSVDQSRVGTGILEHLFKHSEATCSEVIRMGGLKAILYDCRSSDVETLRHCAAALANLALYGGPDNQHAMIRNKVPVWLFPLAFHDDDNIKYYACLAIASLVANKEIEAAVLRSGTLDLVEPFVTAHSPEEFANSTVAHVHGQSKTWLHRLVPVLNSKREEARSLAAFHFAMEAGIKKKQSNTAIFYEICAVDVLKKVASSPNAIASKYAAQALQLIGEEVPHKLSQQVPLWTVEDVREWVKQIGFSMCCQEFVGSRVDGDLLLQLTENMLKEDIGIHNGILRRRFLRELNQLKRMADYTSCDSTYVNPLLQALGPEFCQYTYQMLLSGVQRETLRYLTEEQLAIECGVDNSIHRLRIMQAIRGMTQFNETDDEDVDTKCLDVFISYRRSNGSQLASLLKVHLQLRGFSVFIDVERLEAGKFDNNLLNSIRQAKHFLLVLTPNALDRCIGDTDCKDWVHREIVEALQSQCNIIPILDSFQWPEPEMLPEDMRAVCYFNGVRWIHDYQDACVDKLERFMRGEMNVRSDGPLGRYVGMGGPGTPGTPSTLVRAPPYQRSTSNDSAKGSTCSEKDLNGNGRLAELHH